VCLTDEPELSVLTGQFVIREQEDVLANEISPEMARALAMAYQRREDEAEGEERAQWGSSGDKRNFDAMRRESRSDVPARREEPKVLR